MAFCPQIDKWFFPKNVTQNEIEFTGDHTPYENSDQWNWAALIQLTSHNGSSGWHLLSHWADSTGKRSFKFDTYYLGGKQWFRGRISHNGNLIAGDNTVEIEIPDSWMGQPILFGASFQLGTPSTASSTFYLHMVGPAGAVHTGSNTAIGPLYASSTEPIRMGYTDSEDYAMLWQHWNVQPAMANQDFEDLYNIVKHPLTDFSPTMYYGFNQNPPSVSGGTITMQGSLAEEWIVNHSSTSGLEITRETRRTALEKSAYIWNGIDQYMSLANGSGAEDFNPAGDFTVFCLHEYTATDIPLTAGGDILARKSSYKDGGTPGTASWEMYNGTGSTTKCVGSHNGSTRYIQSTGTLYEGTRVLSAVTFDLESPTSLKMTMYLISEHGTNISATTTIPAKLFETTHPVELFGTIASTVNLFKGMSFYMGFCNSTVGRWDLENLYNRAITPESLSPFCLIDFSKAVGATYTSEIGDYVFDVIGTPELWTCDTVPQLAGALAIEPNKVKVVFDKEMKNNAALIDTTNYTFEGAGLLPTNPDLVVRVDGTVVEAQLNQTMLQSAPHSVEVSNVVGLDDAPIDPFANKVSFYGMGIQPTKVGPCQEIDWWQFPNIGLNYLQLDGLAAAGVFNGDYFTFTTMLTLGGDSTPGGTLLEQWGGGSNQHAIKIYTSGNIDNYYFNVTTSVGGGSGGTGVDTASVKIPSSLFGKHILLGAKYDASVESIVLYVIGPGVNISESFDVYPGGIYSAADSYARLALSHISYARIWHIAFTKGIPIDWFYFEKVYLGITVPSGAPLLICNREVPADGLGIDLGNSADWIAHIAATPNALTKQDLRQELEKSWWEFDGASSLSLDHASGGSDFNGDNISIVAMVLDQKYPHEATYGSNIISKSSDQGAYTGQLGWELSAYFGNYQGSQISLNGTARQTWLLSTADIYQGSRVLEVMTFEVVDGSESWHKNYSVTEQGLFAATPRNHFGAKFFEGVAPVEIGGRILESLRNYGGNLFWVAAYDPTILTEQNCQDLYDRVITPQSLNPFFMMEFKEPVGATYTSEIGGYVFTVNGTPILRECDETPPGPITNLVLTPGTEQITLNWDNPTDPDFEGVMFRRKTTGYPTSPTDGDLAYDGLDETFIDPFLDPEETYYYSAYAYDEVPNYSTETYGNASPIGGPKITSAIAYVSKVRVVFDSDMSDVGLTTPGNYTFVGPFALTTASVVKVDSTTVDVFVNEYQKQGGAYTITIENVKNTFGDVINPLYNDKAFTGVGIIPIVESASVIDVSTIRVQYSKLMFYDSELEKAANYVFSGPTSLTSSLVSASDSGGKTRADVTLNEEMLTGGAYTIEASNVADLVGNPLDTGNDTADFTGEGVAPRVGAAATVIDETTVRIVYDERVVDAQAEDVSSYSILPTLAISSVTRIIDDFTYELITATHAPNELYTITVSSAVEDIAGNTIDPSYNTSEFYGAETSPPEIWMEPEDGTTDADDVNIRTKIRIIALDTEQDFTGIDVSTLDLKVSRLTDSGSTIEQPVVEPGDLQYVGGEVIGNFRPGFEGKVTGDPLNQVTGVMFHFIPKSHWLPDTTYTVTATISDLSPAIPNQNTFIGTFRTDVPLCFEDDMSDQTALDATLISGFPAYPNNDKLRQVLMQNCTTSKNRFIQARTLMYLATKTEMRTVIAGYFDYALVDSIKLCDRVPTLLVKQALDKYKKTVRAAIDEVPELTRTAKDMILQYYEGSSPIYVVNAVALVVLLTAVFGEE